MSLASHQTIRLSKGRHSSPEEGACVMELASMLAGESFTDHPVSVCPVIGSLLRAYNDSVNDERRQDLYAYASKVVGTRARPEVERIRAERVAAWTSEMRQRRLRWFLPAPAARVICRMWRPPLDSVGTHAVLALPKHTDQTHDAVLALTDELVAIRDARPQSASSAPASELTPVG